MTDSRRTYLMRRICQTSLLGLTAFSIPAFAETAPASPPSPQAAPAASQDGQLEEITVTAQRRNAALQRTPLSVFAFTPEAIEARQILSVSDVAASTPNVNMTSVLANQSTTTAFIRGAGQADGGFSFTEAAVGIYVDDVYHARLSGTNLEFNDVARIEVLRGPQGTLYGRNNLTGAIKIVRKQPDGTTFGDAETSVGSRGYNTQKATFSTALVPDKFAILVSGFRVHQGDYYPALAFGDKRGKRDEYGARLGLAYIGSDVFDAKFNAAYTHDKGDGAAPISVTDNLQPRAGGFDYYISPLKNYGLNKQFSTDLSLSAKLGSVTLKSITAYIHANDQFRFDVFGGTLTDGVYGVGFDRTSHGINKQFSQEFQALGDLFNGRLTYIGGLYYFREDIRQRFDDVLLGFQVLPDSIHQTTNSYAAFGQLTFKATDTISATVGLRYTKENKAIDATLSNGVFIFPQTLTAVSNKASFSAATPKFELDWQATPSIFTYASFSRGFQSGGFNASAVADPALFVIPYGKETISAYEGGVKADLLDRHLRINADYFYNRFGGLQLNVSSGNSVATQNAGTAAVHGPEVEFTILPVKGLTVYGNGSRTFGKYLKVNPDSQVAIFDATEIPRVSKWQTQIGFSYKLPLSEALNMPDSAGSVRIGGDYSYRSKYNSNPANLAIGAMTAEDLFNGFIGWTSANEKLDVTLSAKNLLNNRFYVAGFTFGSDTMTKLINDPRLVRLTLKYHL